MYINRLFIALCLLFVTIAAKSITIDEVPNVHVANRLQYVSNPSGVLSPEAVNRLNATIGQLWKDTSVELVVVAVDEIDPSMTAEEFATELFEKWGIGKSDNDNGVLFLISRDDHKAQIRTGYGVEGAMPDIVAWRILRDKVFPLFREENYDGGIEAGVDAISAVITDPSVRAELMSGEESDRYRDEDDFDGEAVFSLYLYFAVIVALVMLITVLSKIITTRKMDDVERWNRLNTLWVASAVVAFVTLGMGAIPFAILSWKMHRVRRHSRKCPHCGTRMELVDEVHDNDYLSPSQDLEEKLNSVDYDVWHCPKCAQTDIYPYENRASNYKECPQCHARTMSLTERRILYPATTRQEGQGVDIYYCRNCGNHTSNRFRIPRKQNDAAIATGAILGSAIGGRGGGGGFSGGSFGGGHTGGGGAGGSW